MWNSRMADDPRTGGQLRKVPPKDTSAGDEERAKIHAAGMPSAGIHNGNRHLELSLDRGMLRGQGYGVQVQVEPSDCQGGVDRVGWSRGISRRPSQDETRIRNTQGLYGQVIKVDGDRASRSHQPLDLLQDCLRDLRWSSGVGGQLHRQRGADHSSGIDALRIAQGNLFGSILDGLDNVKVLVHGRNLPEGWPVRERLALEDQPRRATGMLDLSVQVIPLEMVITDHLKDKVSHFQF